MDFNSSSASIRDFKSESDLSDELFLESSYDDLDEKLIWFSPSIMCRSATGDEFNELFVEQLLMADSSERYPSSCLDSLKDPDASANGDLSLSDEI